MVFVRFDSSNAPSGKRNPYIKNKERGGNKMFNFAIINTPDGNQVIDRTKQTPCDILDSFQLLEYMEVEEKLSVMDSLKRKQRMKRERRQRVRNPFYRLASICGII